MPGRGLLAFQSFRDQDDFLAFQEISQELQMLKSCSNKIHILSVPKDTFAKLQPSRRLFAEGTLEDSKSDC
jgi:hypothetical protein